MTPFYVLGIDEAGRGPLAGPVTAACVCLPAGYENSSIGDSKQLTEKKREELYGVIQRDALAWSVVSVGPRRIDSINILQATKLAMRLSGERVRKTLLSKNPEARTHFLIDGNGLLATELSQETIIKGDQRLLCIGAASILAKVTRDRLMESIAARYSEYGFSKHKGYGTEFHRQKIQELGPSKIHRWTFGGVVEFVPESRKGPTLVGKVSQTAQDARTPGAGPKKRTRRKKDEIAWLFGD